MTDEEQVARMVAGRMVQHHGADLPNLEYDEILSVAWIAAETARLTFDPGRGATLRSWEWASAFWAVRRWMQTLRDVFPTATVIEPPHVVEMAVARVTLERLLNVVSEQEREVVRRYYWNGQRQVDIARLLGHTQGRVSQIKGAALAKMRAAAHASG